MWIVEVNFAGYQFTRCIQLRRPHIHVNGRHTPALRYPRGTPGPLVT